MHLPLLFACVLVGTIPSVAVAHAADEPRPFHFGYGWSLAGLAIERAGTKVMVRFTGALSRAGQPQGPFALPGWVGRRRLSKE